MGSHEDLLYCKKCNACSEGSVAHWAAIFLVRPLYLHQVLSFSLVSSPMLFIGGFIIAIEYMPGVETSVLIQYQTIILIAGLVFVNTLTCRVFRLLRELKLQETSINPSIGASDVLFYSIPRSN